jgi:radical SAM superfamily enzyme YgiQ (UPF0313 family)
MSMTIGAELVVSISGRRAARRALDVQVLLVGPHDPKGGEYTFLAPPLGVWRLAGVLEAAGVSVRVFDPNCCAGDPEKALTDVLGERRWTAVGFSTTGMTLAHDLTLVHLVRRRLPGATLIAGGMEATFNVDAVMKLAPFDLAVLGEGEEPLLDVVRRLAAAAPIEGVPGTAWRDRDGHVRRAHRPALTRDGLKDAIFQIPYERMPYQQYWDRLERSCRVGDLPVKAEREARLAEIRSVRLITLNYCPMGCTFCSSTNFLNAAQGGTTAKVGRLDADECLSMIRRIVDAHPKVRTIIFQDDIFVFRNDHRILPLCEAIVAAKARGDIPRALQFISTNRIDAMTGERLAAMRRAGFRVLGFGVESFSLEILREFNKAQIHPFITPVLEQALSLGVTPFLDMILTSPRCGLEDLAENIRQAFRWVEAGCEVGIYPYVIPFSGAALASDPALTATTEFARRDIPGSGVSWQQAMKILPLDATVREAILEIESRFESALDKLSQVASHLPSRVRSLVWIMSAAPVLERHGCETPARLPVAQALIRRLPRPSGSMRLVFSLADVERPARRGIA